MPENPDGTLRIRRVRALKLMRSDSPVFALSWMVMHPLDADSPFYGSEGEALLNSDMQIVVSMTGLDTTVSQTIHARHIYLAPDILPERRFVDVVTIDPQTGDRSIDYDDFHRILPLA
ncbi:MAG: hypothetical protein HC838_02380 [Spirulinaceae cyanobacterium RM2_2_10]|nr:hypothetical protein [Spirulinaceae cyanobacterium RM2_2_10]